MHLARTTVRAHASKNTVRWRQQCRRSHVRSGVLEELRNRGLVADVTRPEQLEKELEKKSQTIYLGVDPTAPFLHAGHLVPLLSLLHFHLRGHQVIPLIGGATGLIGDPSGRSTERPLSARETIETNVTELTNAINQFFEGAVKYALKRIPFSHEHMLPPNVQNNLTWLKDLNLLVFLRNVGYHSRVNTMLARESVQARLSSQQGISFTEFTYQLLQAYDFYILHKALGCTIQIGGSDQWGNIIAGIDLINRANAVGFQDSGPVVEKGFGITTPLLTTASGQKFGKSAGNAICLHQDYTSVFDFYQFFLRSSDADVERFLKMFTLLPLGQIELIMEAHKENPETRGAQRLLADEVTELVHGEVGMERAKLATRVLYEGNISTVQTRDVILALRGSSVLHFYDESQVLDIPLPKLATTLKIASSNKAARQLISSKGLYLNNIPVMDIQQKLTLADFIDERLAFLRAGSQKVAVLCLT